MPNYNVEIEGPRWCVGWKLLAETLGAGYEMCIYEYTNDVSCRELIERYRDHPAIKKNWALVSKCDDQIKTNLIPTKKCIHGEYPESHFWYWMYPPNSPELERDLREIGAI